VLDQWGAYPGGTVTPVAGALHLTTLPGSKWSSAATVIGATGPGMVTCVDVTNKYSGIALKISSPTNKTLVFVVPTPETTADSSHFRKTILVNTAPTVVQVLFAELGPPSFGAGQVLPLDYKPAQHMTGLGFGVGLETELLDVTIDDVTFF
jgi:hypothetical protein